MLLSALLVTLASGPPSRSPGAAPDSLMGPGVSQTLAVERAARISGVRYDLSLDVTGADTATGLVTVRFQLRTPGDVILDFRGAQLRPVRANGIVVPDAAYNGQHVRIPAHALTAGANRLDFEFSTLIAAAGASIIRVRDPSDGATYLYTLLVPSDAEQLFPCFDQPDLKARVNLTLTTPLGWRAVANGAALRADSSSRGTTYVFHETEPISTYLIAFAAGPWATFSSEGTSRPVTLYVRRSRAREVEADSILRDADRAVAWLEDYFASPYPFGKLDVLLAPAFPFGGMEHPGAIFFSEERFIYREAPTLPQRLGRTATIFHEVAHQWFGDLVTMKWFDDLWLKEGFATYMAAKMQDALQPDAGVWKSFYLRNKPAAYAVDMTDGTTPIWQQLDNLDQAKSNYGAIVYNKAPGVLKQLNHLVGDTAFRKGLQRFVKSHAFANATWRDLLDAVGKAWGHSLKGWGDNYILRPGMPVLEQQVAVRDGRLTSLSIEQRPARPLSGSRPWPIRTDLVLVPEVGAPRRLSLTLTGRRTTVREAVGLPAPAWIFANDGDYAYAEVLLDPGSVAWLEQGLGGVRDSFERAMLWGALWDLVRDAYLSPVRFIHLALRELPAETDEQIVSGIVGRLARATTTYLAGVNRDAYLPDVERALLDGARDTTRAYGIRKAQFDALVRLAATPPMLDTIDAMLDSTALLGLPVGATTRWAIVTRLVAAGASGASARLAAEMRRDATAEGARRAFVAGAARPDPAVKRTYFARYFADTSLNEDWATASLDAFNAPESRALALPYLRAALDSLPWIQRNRRIFYLGSWLDSFISAQVSPEALETIRQFLEERPALAPDLRAKILQSTDELERAVRIRARFGDG